MRVTKAILWMLFFGALFAGGYLAGVWTSNDPAYKLVIYKNGEEEQSSPGKVITDVDNQSVLDTFLGIYIGKESVENTSVDIENPDLSFKLISPKRHVGLSDSRLWFTEEGAIIGERSGETWKHTDFFKISELDAEYIQSMMDEK